MIALHWFRNDLRVDDNRALARAARDARALACVFVLDPRLLRGPGAPRRRFLLACLEQLAWDLRARGSGLLVRRGDPVEVIPSLANRLGAGRITWSVDVSPYARRRDAAVARRLSGDGREVRAVEDRAVFGPDEIRSRAGEPYAVFTPYRRAWWRRMADSPPLPEAAPSLPPPPRGEPGDPPPTASEMNAGTVDIELPEAGSRAAADRLGRFLERGLRGYTQRRDRPDLDGTSRLSPYLRFGAISARECVDGALALAQAEPALEADAQRWIDEIIWRDFYQAILAHHPHVLRGAQRPEYDALEWDDDPRALEAWTEGRTGFPLVDAGMRQLAATGWMHNRARMVVASFLTKDLGIDWRRGERVFMERLIDGDPASNNGGWQWSASTGTDAQPFFRIFNPVAQSERFDPEGAYIARWIPELRDHPAPLRHRPWRAPLETGAYPPPRVDHAERRERTLRRYRAARQRAGR